MFAIRSFFDALRITFGRIERAGETEIVKNNIEIKQNKNGNDKKKLWLRQQKKNLFLILYALAMLHDCSHFGQNHILFCINTLKMTW